MRKPSTNASALRITLWYALLAGAWILASDLLTGWLTVDPDRILLTQVVKGLSFVSVTALLLFILIRRQLQCERHYLLAKVADEERIAALGQFRESVIDNASMWLNVLDPDGAVVMWNKAAEQISGYRRDEVIGNPRIWELLYPDPAYRAEVGAKVTAILHDGAEVEGFETTIMARNGERKVIAWNSRRFFAGDGRLSGSIAIGHDVTARRRAEQALVESERQLSNLLSNLPGMAYRSRNDRDWTMLFVSHGCEELTGYSAEDLVDNHRISFAEVIHPEDRERVWDEVQKALAAKRPFALEYRLLRADGELRWVWEQGGEVITEYGRYLDGIITDITDRRHMEEELARLASHDPLTGLYNRRELEQQLSDELARGERYHRPLSVLWLDVDHFKLVNDTLGHHAGDDVLRQLCRLLEQSVRKVDYVARYGGEELVIVMPEMGARGAAEMAERLRRTIQQQTMALHDGRVTQVTVSIGVAAFPEHGHDMDGLLQAADQAMYLAKQAGRNRVNTAAVTPLGAGE